MSHIFNLDTEKLKMMERPWVSLYRSCQGACMHAEAACRCLNSMHECMCECMWHPDTIILQCMNLNEPNILMDLMLCNHQFQVSIQQNLRLIDREVSAIKKINDENVTWEVFSRSNYRFQTRGNWYVLNNAFSQSIVFMAKWLVACAVHNVQHDQA